MKRRDFIRLSIGAGVGLATAGMTPPGRMRLTDATKSSVYIVAGKSRSEMLSELLDLYGRDTWRSGITGKNVVLKPNFNSAHEFPGGSHPEMVELLMHEVQAAKPGKATLIDRSGMGNTAEVMNDLGIFDLGKKHGIPVIDHEKVPGTEMVKFELGGSHWSKGVEWPKLYTEADSIIQACCLKTHQYGGHFTLSLKNTVGMVNKYDSESNYNYMRELHRSPDQRRMIAEINLLYQPHLVIMDASKCFIDGGPHVGTVREPGLMLAATDRVALDAVGVAILRHYGATPEVQNGPIFELEQLKRAAELGVGVGNADAISLVAANREAEAFADSIRSQLAA